MGFLFTPKHQKLVNQCYPPGRTPDKKPKSSETSYLLYYVNSRRPKLEKVSSYLVKKSTTDLNRRRLGNVSVTLDLLAKIVENCNENMNIFVKDFINIMTLVLNNNNFNNDPSIVRLVESVLAAICNHLDGSLVSGDSEFLELFKNFVNLFFQVANTKVKDADLVLKGCLDFSKISNLGTIHQWTPTAKNCVCIALSKLQERFPMYSGGTIDNTVSTTGSPVLSKKLTRTQTKIIGLDDVADTSDYSILALNSFFNTTETDKLTLSIHALIDHLLKTPNKELLTFICNGIPVQLRYIVILLCVRAVGTSSESNTIVLLKLISSLLTSGVSIIGLSVIDILRRLTTVQILNADSSKIALQISMTIKDLNYKTYYKQQSFDMFTELSSKFLADGKAQNQKLLQIDLDSLVAVTNDECLVLDLFVELLPFATEKLQLAELLYHNPPHQIVFIRFFESLNSLSKEDAAIAMTVSFEKYKSACLLSGLAYYLNNNKPSMNYYIYHSCAANFLESEEYKTQVKYKKETNEIFSKEDLLNYYSDSGCNEYSDKGKAILLVDTRYKKDNELGADVDHQFSSTQTPAVKIPLPPVNGTILKKSLVGSDARSIKSLKQHQTPKVKDLKQLISAKNNKNAYRTLRGSQSVKSKITNITFLLNELSSDDVEMKIADPDEEDVIGMEKQDLARSYSMKMSSLRSTSSRGIVPALEKFGDKEEPDEFRDAQEDIEVNNSSRGRLFMA